MRSVLLLSIWLLWGLAVGPAAAAVDLLERLEEKGIISAEERQELEQEESPARLVRGDRLTWEARDGRFGSQLFGYGQVRYTYLNQEQGENLSNFSVRRVRVGVKGHAFTKDLTYRVYVNVYSGNANSTDLFDYFIDYRPFREFGVKAGAYKVPYAAQWNTSASQLQFVERTAVDGNFRLDRDTGVDLHGTLSGTLLSYDLGVFNGEGRNRNNSGDGHLWVARLSLDPLGKYPTHESDNEISRQLLARVTAAVAFNDDVSRHTRSNLDGRLQELGPSDVLGYNGFVGFKYRGASAAAEAHYRRIDPQGTADTEVARGFYAQAGYFVWGNRVEVAGRYEVFDPDDSVGGDLRQQYGVALNCFFSGHANKLQADFFRINTQHEAAGSENDNQFRVQWLLAF